MSAGITRMVLGFIVACLVTGEALAVPEDLVKARAADDHKAVVLLGEEYLDNGQADSVLQLRVVKDVFDAYGELGDSEKAVDSAQRHLDRFEPAELTPEGQEKYFGVLLVIGRKLNSLQRTQEAEVVLQRILENEHSKGINPRRAAAFAMAELQAKMGDKGASERLALLMEVFPSTGQVSGAGSLESRAIDRIRRLLPETGASQEGEESRAVLIRKVRQVMALAAGNEDPRLDVDAFCENAQALIVDVRLQQGKFHDALFEAKLLLEIASSEAGMEMAIDRLTKCVRMTDGHFERINRILHYQKHGRPGLDGKIGTDDDLEDPLANVALDDPEARDKHFSELVSQYDGGWRGRLTKGMICRFWGRKREAVEEMWYAYRLAPAEPNTIQLVSNHLVAVLTQATGDPHIGQEFVQFQQFGPAGEDGTVGSGDDLLNPVEEYLR